jgi:hypothetical protein
MGALFNDLPAIHHVDVVGLANRGKAMGNGNRRPVLGNHGQRSLDGGLGLVIHRRGGLIQHQNRRVFENSAGDRQPLPLAPREFLPPLAHEGVIVLGQFFNELMGLGLLGSVDDLLTAGIKTAVANIFRHRAMK